MIISKDKQEGENNSTDLEIDLDIIPYKTNFYDIIRTNAIIEIKSSGYIFISCI